MSNSVNAISGAAKYLRPTLMFTLIGMSFMIVLSVAINKMPKKERKGAGFGIVVLGLISSIIGMMYNFWIYAKETGIAAAAKAQGETLFTKMQAKISGGGAPAGATNIGATTAV